MLQCPEGEGAEELGFTDQEEEGRTASSIRSRSKRGLEEAVPGPT